MGNLVYGAGGQEITFDDRTLAHIKAVVLAKLRRGESFALSWSTDRDGGRDTLWVHPAIPLRFSIGSDTGTINKEWVRALVDAADRGELRVTAEPGTH